MTVHTQNKPTEQAAYEYASSKLHDLILKNLNKKKSCALGIAGGRAIPHIIDMLLPYAPQFLKKGKIEVFWLDERVNQEKNYVDVLPFLEKLSHAQVNIAWHALKSANHENICKEATSAINNLAATPYNNSNNPEFDIIIASSGEDGHIASLFPHHHALKNKEYNYIMINDSPKPPAQRVTASPALLQSAQDAILLFIGDKKFAYQQFIDPNTTIQDCPAKLLLKNKELHIITALNKEIEK